jgi:antitoxin component YwqK of YwqJK toxin-antitoxin module
MDEIDAASTDTAIATEYSLVRRPYNQQTDQLEEEECRYRYQRIDANTLLLAFEPDEEGCAHREVYTNGKLSKAFDTDKNGRVHGIVKTYGSNGQPQDLTTYKNGKKQGLYCEYDGSGDLIIEANYEDDKLNGVRKEFGEGGTLRSETTYKNDLKNGKEIIYFETGGIQEEGFFKDDKPQGEFRTYHKFHQQQMACQEYFGESGLVGLRTRWDTEGKIVECRNYDTAEQIGSIIFQENSFYMLNTGGEHQISLDREVFTNIQDIVRGGLNGVLDNGLPKPKRT